MVKSSLQLTSMPRTKQRKHTAKKTDREPTAWNLALVQARKDLGLTGFVPISKDPKNKDGYKLWQRATALAKSSEPSKTTKHIDDFPAEAVADEKTEKTAKPKRPPTAWNMAVKQARLDLGITGFVPLSSEGGTPGNHILMRAKEIYGTHPQKRVATDAFGGECHLIRKHKSQRA